MERIKHITSAAPLVSLPSSPHTQTPCQPFFNVTAFYVPMKRRRMGKRHERDYFFSHVTPDLLGPGRTPRAGIKQASTGKGEGSRGYESQVAWVCQMRRYSLLHHSPVSTTPFTLDFPSLHSPLSPPTPYLALKFLLMPPSQNPHLLTLPPPHTPTPLPHTTQATGDRSPKPLTVMMYNRRSSYILVART
jgi:hypothetical protein